MFNADYARKKTYDYIRIKSYLEIVEETIHNAIANGLFEAEVIIPSDFKDTENIVSEIKTWGYDAAIVPYVNDGCRIPNTCLSISWAPKLN